MCVCVLNPSLLVAPQKASRLRTKGSFKPDPEPP